MYMQLYHDLYVWGYSEDKLNFLLYDTALTYCKWKKPDEDDADNTYFQNNLQICKTDSGKLYVEMQGVVRIAEVLSAVV